MGPAASLAGRDLGMDFAGIEEPARPRGTSHITGLSRAESDALLQFLDAPSTKPQFTVRYHWHAGDLGFWDNRVTQHSVVGDFEGQHRVIQRVTLRGDRPV
jgi:alpha-ketoglutarate-dependent taurine dioxygenase